VILNCAHSANHKSIGGFLSDLHRVQLCLTVFEIFDAKIL